MLQNGKKENGYYVHFYDPDIVKVNKITGKRIGANKLYRSHQYYYKSVISDYPMIDEINYFSETSYHDDQSYGCSLKAGFKVMKLFGKL